MNAVDSSTDIYQSLGLTGREAEQASTNELTQKDFMKLLVTELTHQDPTKPMDNKELASQISQFSVVSGIDQLNDSFADFSSSMISDQALQASGLVGRDVLVPVNSALLETGGTIRGVVGLDGSAADVRVLVQDGSGALVREIDLGTQPKGEVSFTWDGQRDDGSYAPPGQYLITAQASRDGSQIAPYVLTQASVDSVSVGGEGQGLALNLRGLGAIAFKDVAEIR
ncbi:MAG TPA: flagellar hook assembly protein FlgD [Sedimenticola thiotaurini]|uniref:Basal-body rod modification protein FlgD n=1 Tax=Sedimenticola thiotaurini TaxID=1543721 RepID=A0A831RRF7_9GAMM|nr:flagellar hook assembly protein FlgD [Sedimenticola thiotaurini]